VELFFSRFFGIFCVIFLFFFGLCKAQRPTVVGYVEPQAQDLPQFSGRTRPPHHPGGHGGGGDDGGGGGGVAVSCADAPAPKGGDTGLGRWRSCGAAVGKQGAWRH